MKNVLLSSNKNLKIEKKNNTKNKKIKKNSNFPSISMRVNKVSPNCKLYMPIIIEKKLHYVI